MVMHDVMMCDYDACAVAMMDELETDGMLKA